MTIRPTILALSALLLASSPALAIDRFQDWQFQQRWDQQLQSQQEQQFQRQQLEFQRQQLFEMQQQRSQQQRFCPRGHLC